MQIQELAAKLQSVGLTDKQAKVYVSSLFLGPASVQKIAGQADVKRATTYVILDELEKMGLVSESTEENRTVYIAEPPEAIGRFLDNMKKGIDSRKTELKSLLPELSGMVRAQEAETPVVRFYKNLTGSEEVTKYMLRKARKGDELYALMNIDEVVKLYGNKPAAGQTRVKKGIKAKVIYYTEDGKNDSLVASSKQRMRVSKKSDKNFQTEINLYPTCASILTYKGKNSTTVLIESREAVNTLRQLFELAFENMK